MSNQQLIEEYKQSVADKNRARFTIAGLVLLTVTTFTCLAWNSLNAFLAAGVPEISNLLAAKLASKSDFYFGQVQNSTAKVVPVYSKELQSAFVSNLPELEKTAAIELSALNKFSHDKFPEIENGLLKLTEDQGVVIKSELERVLGKAQGEKIAETHALAAFNNYNDFINSNFALHTETSNSIGVNLRKVVERENEITSNVDANEAIGLALEIAGLELQQIGKR